MQHSLRTNEQSTQRTGSNRSNIESIGKYVVMTNRKQDLFSR